VGERRKEDTAVTDRDDDLEPIPANPPAVWTEPTPTAAPGDPGTRPPAPPRRTAIVGLVVAMLVAGGIGYGLTAHLESGKSFDNAVFNPGPSRGSTPGNGSPGTTSPSDGGSARGGNDKSAGALARVVVQQRDVTSGHLVTLITDGDQVRGTTTLDLCNGSYASETLRTARLQVAEVDPTGTLLFSTEAVLYGKPADTSQAFSELRSVHDNCPDRPVVSPAGEPTVTTTFQGAPDANWHTATGVDRLAFALTTVDTQGQKASSIAVYMRKGRALLGVYFSKPTDPQPAIAGKTSVADIVALFSQRLAALPTSVTNP
jgi:hypothetical protein